MEFDGFNGINGKLHRNFTPWNWESRFASKWLKRQCLARHNNNVVSNEDVLIENIFSPMVFREKLHSWGSEKGSSAMVLCWSRARGWPFHIFHTAIRSRHHIHSYIVSCSIMVCWMMIISYDTFSNKMDRASSSSLFRYVRVHFATFKSHARTSLREVVVDPIAGDTLGEKQSKNQVESGLKTLT